MNKQEQVANGFMVSQDTIKEAAPLLPNYYCKAISKLTRQADLSGLRVLEVGGYSVPKAVANELLGVRQWVSLDLLDFAGGGYQLKNLPEYVSDRPVYRLDKDSIDWKESNFILDGDALHFARMFDQQFDVVFSVNCFEHMPNLFSYLRLSKRNLVSGGIFYTQFGPIWTCCSGHHIRVDEELDFSRPGFLDQFQHLLLDRWQMLDYLIDLGIEKPRAETAVYQIYNSPTINRYTFDDYVRAFNGAEYTHLDVHRSFTVEPSSGLLAQLQARHPNVSDFSAYELTVKCVV